MNAEKRNYAVLKALAALVCFFVMPLYLYMQSVEMWLILSVVAFAALCFVCFRNFNENIFFIFFLVSLFIFLISGDLAEAFFDKRYYLQFSDAAVKHSHFAIFLSLIFVFIGYSVKKVPEKKTVVLNESQQIYIASIRYSAKIVYYVTWLILAFNKVDEILFVTRYGYVSYYTSYSPLLPNIIAQLADFAPIALCVFLATFPVKKECKLPIVLYFIFAVMSLLMGQRGGLIYNVVFLLAYIFYRNKRDKNVCVWITKRAIVLLCVSVPFLLVGLFLYEFVRNDMAVEYTSFGDTLVEFFVNIGSSSKVIKYGYEYQDAINEFKFYSLGDTLNYFKYSELFHFFDSDPIPASHTAEFALGGHSFSSFLTYVTTKESFLDGHGLGSSYVAVLFADFGYLGVAAGSFVYGILFKSISSLSEANWLTSAIKLYCFLYLVYAPRSSYDGFIGCIVNVTFWIVIFGIWLFAYLIRNNGNIKLKKPNT